MRLQRLSERLALRRCCEQMLTELSIHRPVQGVGDNAVRCWARLWLAIETEARNRSISVGLAFSISTHGPGIPRYQIHYEYCIPTLPYPTYIPVRATPACFFFVSGSPSFPSSVPQPQ